MSAHSPMPKSAWIFPLLAVLLFVAVTATGYNFTPTAGGLLFAAVLLVILFGTVFAPAEGRRSDQGDADTMDRGRAADAVQV